jgi:hypothetical protein
MAQTFDIRFARSAGLAAFLEVPENRFRWKGGGLLRIDSRGISIGVKRGLLALLGGKRTQRILTANLRAVYREGDALRVEYQSGSANVVLPFWADNRDAAAQIVRMLPTRQTVEIEETTNFAKPPADWRMLSSFAVALAAIAVGTWAVYQRNSLDVASGPVPVSDAVATVAVAETTPTPTSATAAQNFETSTKPAQPAPWYEAPAIPLSPSRSAQAPSARPERSDSTKRPVPSVAASDTTASPGSTPVPAATPNGDASSGTWVVRVSPDGIIPLVPGMPAYEAARRQLDLFQAESNTLRGHFRDARYAGNMQRFREISILWEKVSIRVGNSPDFQDPTLRPLQEIELAVSRAWRRALSLYEDPALLVSADDEVEFAEMLEARARQFVN